MSIRYHVIGAASLGRQPICYRQFRPSLLGFGKSPTTELKPQGLRSYLTGFCPSYILSQPAEPDTEISAAILTALQDTAMVGRDTPRIMIILSDFKEETRVRYQLGRTSLAGVHTIMLWRTLPEDRRRPAGLSQRIAHWRQMIERHGGKVDAFTDATANYSPAEFSALIEGDN